MANSVNIRLTATDEVSAKIDILRDRLSRLSTVKPVDMARATIINSQIQRLQDSLGKVQAPDKSQGFLGASLFGSLGASAITSALQLVTQGIQGTFSAIKSAASTQITGLAQAGDLATQLNIKFDKAKDLVSDTRVEISKMAAELPGNNSDYNAIFEQVSSTVSGYVKGDVDRFKTESMELTKRFGVLASIRQVNAQQGGSALNRLLAGTAGLTEVFGTNDLFQKNPLLKGYIQEQLKLIGKSDKDWQKLTTETRARILQLASKKAVTDETIASFEGTTDSMLQLANTVLFDQDTGLFGFLRKVKEAGNRSGLDAVQGVLTQLFKVFSNLSKSMGGIDPMAVFIRFADWLSDVLFGINKLLTVDTSTWAISDFDNLTSMMTDGLVGMVNDAIATLRRSLSRIDWSAVGKGLYLTIKAAITAASKISWSDLFRFFYDLNVGIAKAVVVALWEGVKDAGRLLVDGLKSAFKWVIDNTKSALGSLMPTNSSSSPLDTFRSIAMPSLESVVNPLSAIPKLGQMVGEQLVKPKPPEPKTTTNSFSPTINVPVQSGSPKENAQAMLDALNTAFRQYKEGNLAYG